MIKIEKNETRLAETVWLESELTQIHTKQDLEIFIKANKTSLKLELASDYFLKCLKAHGLTYREFNKQIASVEINGKPLIGRTFISHFLGNTKPLSRDNLFILAIFAKMGLDEVAHFLNCCGIRPFYPKDDRDYFLQFVFKRNSEAPDAVAFYHEVEHNLIQSGFRPLCSKIPFKGTYSEPIPFIEADTGELGTGLQKAQTKEDYDKLAQENAPYLADAEYLKNEEATKYLLQCCLENGLKDTDFVNKILTYYDVSSSHVYHVLNIKRNSKIKANTTRDGLIAFSIIGGLRLDQINRVLQLSNFPPLYARNQRDFCISFCILEKYDYYQTEQELEHQGLAPLNESWGKASDNDE